MPNYLVSHHGAQGFQAEPFVFTLALSVGAQTSTLAVAEHVVEVFESLWATTPTAADYVSGNTSFTHVTVAEILDLIEGDLTAGARADFTDGLIGSGGTTLPVQCSLAVSLKAGSYANGTPIRGRFFLPAPGSGAIDQTGNLEPLLSGTVADWCVAYFDALAQGVGESAISDVVPSVWSRKMGSLTPVSEVKVGRVVDTIRSRNNIQPELYEARQWSVPA